MAVRGGGRQGWGQAGVAAVRADRSLGRRQSWTNVEIKDQFP